MAEVAYAPAPEYDEKKYQKAKASIGDPNLDPGLRAERLVKIADYEKSQAELTQAHGYTQSSQLDPAKEAIVQKVRMATRDDTLKNNSGLKVFGGQTEYIPPPKPVNPFSALGLSAQSADLPTSHAWREPTVKDFRAALAAGGSLAERTKAELVKGAYGDDSPPEAQRGPNEHAAPKVKDITQLGNRPADPALMDDAALQNTEAFRAYQDAAWNHALSDSIAKRKPIYRLKHTDKLSPEEKAIAEAQDIGGAVLGGAGQSATLGLLDPLKRFINPELAAKDRQQRNRNPKAEMAGELGGAFVGAPEVIARGSAKMLGSALGDTALGRLGASAGAGAVTGGVDLQTRSIAQAAADALDAGDSAQEMASRIYDALSGKTILEGAALGTGAAVTGHAIGSVLNKGARKIVTSGEQGPVVERNLGSGGKMDWKGQIKTEPRLEDLQHGAAAEQKFADEILAERALDPIATHQLGKQEAAARKAVSETAIAQERLGDATVDSQALSQRLAEYAKGMDPVTPRAQSVSTALRRMARMIRDKGNLTPAEIDKLEKQIDRQANYKGKDPDPDWNEAGRILKDFRDEFQFNEPTEQFVIGAKEPRTAERRPPVLPPPTPNTRDVTPEGFVSQNELSRLENPVKSAVAPQPRTDPDAAKRLLGANSPEVGAALKNFGESAEAPPHVGQFAIRDELGNSKVVSGYSGMKKGQERALSMAETENQQLGLPKRLEATPTELPRMAASDAEAGRFLSEHQDLPSVLKYLNEERAAASRLERGDTPSDLTPTRVNSAMQATTGANRALRDAVKSGHVYPGTVYRGVGMTPDKIQEMIAKGEIKSDSIWSAAKDQDYAAEFAKKSSSKGRQGVVFEIDSRSAVPLDDIPGSNTYNEAAIPIGENFRITDSYRSPDGTMIVKLQRNYPSADDLATADTPKVKLDFSERRTGVRSLMDAGSPGGNLPKKLQVATDAGVGKEVADIVRLRDRADYRKMLGAAVRGVSAGPGGLGNKFISSAQLLRLVPAMKSLGGGLGKTGLPAMEASDEMVSLIDRYVSDLGTHGGREHVAKRVMGEMVPEAKVLNLRGGQPAKVVGAVTRNEKGDDAKLTPEESAVAKAVIRQLIKLQEGK